MRLQDQLHVEGYFWMVARERGKIVPGSIREGKNVVTLAGKEFITGAIAYASMNGTPTGSSPITGTEQALQYLAPIGIHDTIFRPDKIRYVGFGTSSQPEVPTVTRLVSPIAYDAVGGNFLAQMAVVSRSGGAITFARTFSEAEISLVGAVTLTEAGLFTDGDPLQSYTPRSRVRDLAHATAQVPAAYKVLDPFKKTANFALDVNWTLRF